MDANLIAIIGIVVAIFCTWWAIVQNWKVAHKLDILRRSKAELFFLNTSLAGDRIHSNRWVIVLPGDKNDDFIVPLHFIIKNNGDFPIKDAVLSVTASELLIRNAPPEAFRLSTIPGVFVDSVKRSVVELGVHNFNQVSYLISSIPPRASYSIEDAFVLGKYLFQQVKATAQSKDKVDMEVDVSFTLSVMAVISLILSDSPATSYTEWLSGIHAKSCDEAIENYFKSKKKQPKLMNYSKLIGTKIKSGRSLSAELYTFVEFEPGEKTFVDDRWIHLLKPKIIKIKTVGINK